MLLKGAHEVCRSGIANVLSNGVDPKSMLSALAQSVFVGTAKHVNSIHFLSRVPYSLSKVKRFDKGLPKRLQRACLGM